MPPSTGMIIPVLDVRCVIAAIAACATSSAVTTRFRGVVAATRSTIAVVRPGTKAVSTAAGETVYTWSANKTFTAEFRELKVSGEKNWAVTEELTLKPGDYVLEAWLTTAGPAAYRAQLPITVAAIEPAN